MDLLRRWAPAAWAWLLAALLLGPALGWGYVLTFDMVWVPDLAVRGDFFGAGTALPRAVPSDLVVAVLDEVVPGMLLQKVVLLGALGAGGLGAARLAGPSAVARVAGTTFYVWTPFVVERLWLGHWPILLCWAALPWLVLAAARYRADGRLGAALPLLLLVASLSANAGAMAALVVCAVGVTRRVGPALRLLAAVAAANAPWLVSGALHAGAATGTETAAFALRGEGPLPAPVAALTLGGIWNGAVVPDSRETVLAWVGVLVLVPLAALGARPAWRRLGPRTAGALVVVWIVGFAVATWTWAAPGSLEWTAAHLPGAGILRDGARALALCAPLAAVLLAAGVERVARRLHRATGESAARFTVAAAAVAVPLGLMPDASWGFSGQLAPATYPAGYAAARAALEGDRPAGDLLVLPFTSYRAPSWNGGRRVLDPLPRYLQPDYVVNDELAVSGRILPGEDPRTPEVLAALALPDAAERTAALAGLGIGLVAREPDAPTSREYDAPVVGRVLVDTPSIELIALDADAVAQPVPTARRAALTGAWAAYAALVLWGVAALGWWIRKLFRSA
ncbi:hypothetical protein E8D34_02535 [Nocardioides sp. GY 10113]|uniref:hypothetical protein n=1 Tax=Nocardioides sp. GY 10113 TaxID=2569761 RepID=UPI0010A8EACF|nr:hypothetical protein [Nocardioides sp. GY 10113]TIC88582.1 hypothetical protein E8D34_02535 [Nocardioides sp. GY 10113]